MLQKDWTMNELKEIIEDISKTMSEFSDLLEKRNAELERRAKFDEELSNQIQVLLDRHK